jgi:thiamine-phosphate pyrophosphorylase
MTPLPKKGLYAITKTANKSLQQISDAVFAAIKGGASIIQYRNKHPFRDTHPIDTREIATALLKICRNNNVPLIINDDIELAANIDADGVHLGKDDGQISEARKHLGSESIIGISCYNDLPRAVTAQQQGASYVAFGRFFTSRTKPHAPTAAIETLITAKQHLDIPIVAIGGILPENGSQLVAAGADFLAVVDGVFAENPEQAAKNYCRLFQ